MGGMDSPCNGYLRDALAGEKSAGDGFELRVFVAECQQFEQRVERELQPWQRQQQQR